RTTAFLADLLHGREAPSGLPVEGIGQGDQDELGGCVRHFLVKRPCDSLDAHILAPFLTAEQAMSANRSMVFSGPLRCLAMMNSSLLAHSNRRSVRSCSFSKPPPFSRSR